MASPDATTALSVNTTETTPAAASALDDVAEAVAQVSLQDEAATSNLKTTETPPRPLKVYTRHEILHISKSPLVVVPEGMPAFKDWFGDWNEQVGSKKESEASTTTNGRDRRFRRDADDGDSSRPSFRSGLSQPSQMGNFRHQSIRTTERTGDKDPDRERERDLRDREGQEQIRNLSDKYDRDRLASNLRNKERDAAPHLSGASASRLAQAQSTGRRGEGRDAAKRKAGETSDDWRRGAEPNRAGRDDRTDSRRDRDARERPRSRVRDTSRARREPSTTRRDRDRDRVDRDRLRDRRGDADRDDRRDKDDRRDRDDYMRRDWDDDRYEYGRRLRDRDGDRDADEDPRRWRDDGRRDERMAARREGRDREPNRPWDRLEDRDRERPSAGDDRDARNRRGPGRERRTGGGNDDTKDSHDRRERDKEREAEPAWMDYNPTTPGGGILGAKGADGELDSIQAWKRGMKEKERKEKGEVVPEGGKTNDSNGNSEHPPPVAPSASISSEGQMDEIQLFKMMMKREAEKKEGEKTQNGLLNQTLNESGPPGLSSSPSLQSQKSEGSNIADSTIVVQRASDTSKVLTQETNKPPPRPEVLATPAGSSRPSVSSSPSIDRPIEASRVVGPRMGHVTPGIPSSAINPTIPHTDLPTSNASPANTFNPPPGSRVLALKSRVPSGGSTAPPGMNPLPPPGIATPHAHPLTPSAGLQPHLGEAIPNDMQYVGPRMTPSDSSRAIRSFSPLNNGSQPNLPMEDLRESLHISQLNELRRASGSSAAERAILGLPGDAGSPFGELGGSQAAAFPPGIPLDPSGSNVPGGANYAASKGSRFAKFFDAKAREVQPTGPPRLGQQVPGMPPAIPHPSQRQESMSLGGMPARGERTMEDIFAMLQSSTQGHRGSPQIPPSSRMPQVGGQFPQSNLELQLLQQQQQQQLHQQLAQNRLDSLYDSRLDDRSFVPDGLVPGLRPAPPRSRSRESGGVLFNEQIDDPLHFNVQRLTQQRNLEQMYNAQMYNQQGGAMLRNGGLPMQQGHFRGASPISSQNPLQPPSQRLPPGLANLGGRPPHDPSQYLGSGVGIPGGGLHGASPAQQVYNTFTQGGLGFNGNPPVRGPPAPPNPLAVNAMGGLGPNNLDLRAANQAQLLGLAQGNLGGGGMRGSGPGFGPQHGPGGQLSASHLAMRQQLQQQQQQQIPPHMLPHLLPSHLQQQGIPGATAQTTQDLMALLMGGHRE